MAKQPKKAAESNSVSEDLNVEQPVVAEETLAAEDAPVVEMPKPKKAPKAQPELFDEEEELLVLRLGSVDVPVVEDGKGFFKNVNQAAWNLDYQRRLLAYWREQAAENSGFSVEAKKAKLFI